MFASEPSRLASWLDSEAWTRAAIQSLDEGEDQAAIEALRMALASEPTNIQALAILARIQHRIGESSEALSTYHLWAANVALGDNLAPGFGLIALNDSATVNAIFDRLRPLDHESKLDFSSAKLFGDSLMLHGRLSDARAVWRAYLSVDPPVRFRAFASIDLSRLDRALGTSSITPSQLQRLALRTSGSDRAEVYLELAKRLELAGRPTASRRALRNAAIAVEGLTTPREAQAFGVSSALLQNPIGVSKALSRLDSEDNQSTDVIIARARILAASGDSFASARTLRLLRGKSFDIRLKGVIGDELLSNVIAMGVLTSDDKAPGD